MRTRVDALRPFIKIISVADIVEMFGTEWNDTRSVRVETDFIERLPTGVLGEESHMVSCAERKTCQRSIVLPKCAVCEVRRGSREDHVLLCDDEPICDA